VLMGVATVLLLAACGYAAMRMRGRSERRRVAPGTSA
jgi:hypothetical protein